MSNLEEKYPDGIPNSIMSEGIWQDFKKTEAGWCCKAISETEDLLGKKHGALRLMVMSGGRAIFMNVQYCPRCGRKI